MSCYPDYGKAPAEYLLNFTETLAGYSEEVIRAMADGKTGIPARCQYLPTLADMAKFGDEYEAKRHAIRDLRQGRVPEALPPKAFRPYPKLFDAFANEAGLLKDRSFDTITEASKRLATRGVDAAREYLLSAKRENIMSKSGA